MHVRGLDLQTSDDVVIWEHARKNYLTIVSKDSDFHQMSFVLGHPPKVVWVRCGNASTKEIEAVLRQHCDDIRQFHEDAEASLLVLS